MYESDGGLYGRQFIVPGLGRIDLLAEDIQTGSLVVIELKRDESHESVVGQISMYMSWVRENIARKNQPVIGVMCVFTASPKLALAARNVVGLEVFEYRIRRSVSTLARRFRVSHKLISPMAQNERITFIMAIIGRDSARNLLRLK